jgi:hypothetical protein
MYTNARENSRSLRMMCSKSFLCQTGPATASSIRAARVTAALKARIIPPTDWQAGPGSALLFWAQHAAPLRLRHHVFAQTLRVTACHLGHPHCRPKGPMTNPLLAYDLFYMLLRPEAAFWTFFVLRITLPEASLRDFSNPRKTPFINGILIEPDLLREAAWRRRWMATCVPTQENRCTIFHLDRIRVGEGCAYELLRVDGIAASRL